MLQFDCCCKSGVLAVLPALLFASHAWAEDCEVLGTALTEHTCFHASHGPFVARVATAGATPDATTANVDPVHTHYTVTLPAPGGQNVLTYQPVRSGQWAVFVSPPTTPVELRDSSGAPMPLRRTYTETDCPPLPIAHAYDLTAGHRYRIVIGPELSGTVVLVIEKMSDFETLYGRDADEDSYGSSSDVLLTACAQPVGYVSDDSDCDDADAAIHPGATELCDERDNNCNGLVDEGFGVGTACALGVGACERQSVLTCAPNLQSVFCTVTPGLPSPEVCDGVDNDCDGTVDNGASLCTSDDAPVCAHFAAETRCGCTKDSDCGTASLGRVCDAATHRCVNECSSEDTSRCDAYGAGAACLMGGVCGCAGHDDCGRDRYCDAEDRKCHVCQSMYETVELESASPPVESPSPKQPSSCSSSASVALAALVLALLRARRARLALTSMLLSACGDGDLIEAKCRCQDNEVCVADVCRARCERTPECAEHEGCHPAGRYCTPLGPPVCREGILCERTIAEEVIAHACQHGSVDHHTPVQATPNDTTVPPAVDKPHTAYEVTWPGETAAPAALNYRANREGKHVLLLSAPVKAELTVQTTGAIVPATHVQPVATSCTNTPGSFICGLCPAGDCPRPYALTKGHIDLFEVTWDTGFNGLRLNVKDDTNLYEPGAQYRDPTSVAVFVNSALAALDTTPLPSNYDFLKVDGPTIYLLPQTQDLNLPWPGWSTERLVGTLPPEISLPSTGTPVRLDISITGPGNVFTWQTGSFGDITNKYIDTVDPAADFIPVSRNAHVHTNWAFTAQGDYFITVTPSATTTTGATVTGPGFVYLIHVGPASDAAPEAIVAPAVMGTGIVGEALTVADGDWSPLPHGYSYQWLREGAVIPGATSASYVPVSGDIGRLISVRVTASVGAANTVVTTDSVEIITGGDPVDLEPTTVILRTNSAGTQTSTTATYGNNVNLFATVTPNGSGSPSPGGIVEVWTGATKLAQGTITNLTTGRVTIPTPTSGLMLGANSLYARYVPPSTHAVSVSNSVTVTVNPRSTSVAVATSVIEAAFGQAITIGAAVTPAGAPGHLQVLSGATVVAEGPAVNGRLLVAVDDLPLGVHSLSATFTSSVPEYLSSVSPLFLNVPVTIVEGAPRGTWTRTVIDHEHVDAFSATLDGGALHLGTRIDFDGTSKTPLPKYGNNRERIDPAGAVFHLPDMVSIGLGAPGGRKTIPDHPDYAFLGTPGDTIWVAPASNDITPFLYAGFEAESISSGQLFDNRIDIVLVGVDAPPGGRFEAYSGGFSSVWRMLSSTDPLYSSTPFGTGSHDHFNWVFTQLGTYVLHVKAIATLPDGTALESGVIDYTWVVGDLQSAPSVAVNDDAGVVGAAALTATVAPAAEGYVEFRDEGGALIGFAPVMGGIATFPVDFAAGTFTVTAHFLPAALDLYLPASSEATEVSVSL